MLKTLLDKVCIRSAGNQEAESADFGTEAEYRDFPVQAEGEYVQSEATELSEDAKPLGAAETTSELAEALEQSEGPPFFFSLICTVSHKVRRYYCLRLDCKDSQYIRW